MQNNKLVELAAHERSIMLCCNSPATQEFMTSTSTSTTDSQKWATHVQTHPQYAQRLRDFCKKEYVVFMNWLVSKLVLKGSVEIGKNGWSYRRINVSLGLLSKIKLYHMFAMICVIILLNHFRAKFQSSNFTKSVPWLSSLNARAILPVEVCSDPRLEWYVLQFA